MNRHSRSLRHRYRAFVCWFAAILAIVPTMRSDAGSSSPSYSREIRPLLADHCFACHGPDEHKRKADVRLDTADGIAAVVDQDTWQNSLLLERIVTEDSDAIMPPPTHDKPLDANAKALLESWVRAGSPLEDHWAFVPPRRMPPPESLSASDPIDVWIDAELLRKGLQPNAATDRTTIARRVALDLTGLPPTVAQVQRFVTDSRPTAYASYVDRLLQSPAYGEHMARYWLDLVRYGDTHGLHLDNYREMWPYRDWVINAFNDNQPFDRFIIEQIAGDLLPDATLEQKVASGLNRLNITTNEEGSIVEEVLARNVIDRTDAFGTVFLGLTIGCAACHDHRFDPITQTEYYSLSAFFNSLDGQAMDGDSQRHAPSIPYPSFDQIQYLQDINDEIARIDEQMRGLSVSTDHPQRQAMRDMRVGILKLRKDVEDSIPTTLIWKEMQTPRDTFVLRRGQYDDRGKRVSRATPTFLPPIDESSPPDRLTLARWLADGVHPLTARVAVNRFWQQLFGTGLVKTSEDFGSQGSPPSHPEVLDELAISFCRSGWDVKALMKRLVMTRAYRRDAKTTPEMRAMDPNNRLLARGPRFRLDAESLRDQMLSVSGLLVDQMGGPSVKPPQPVGLWAAVGYTDSDTATFVADEGERIYRRGVYTFWKRTSGPPIMTTFDAPSRESCAVRRERTNTPMQALLLLNEPQMLDASLQLAKLAIAWTSDPSERTSRLFEHVTLRTPTADERQTVTELATDLETHYRNNPDQTHALVGSTDPAIAAWMVVSSTLLNLDEVVTK